MDRAGLGNDPAFFTISSVDVCIVSYHHTDSGLPVVRIEHGRRPSGVLVVQ